MNAMTLTMRPIFSLFSITFAALLLLLPTLTQANESFAPIVEDALPAVVNISTTQNVNANIPGIPGIPGLDGDRQRDLERFLERFGFPGGKLPGQGDENGTREVQSLGSGFVIDPDGYVVTNNHVIAEASEVVVIFADDTKLDATVVGRDPKTDLALLKVESDTPLDYVEFGDSDVMRVGDWVIAIGNPFGLGSTVTAGIISARSRNINAGPFDDFLQTDAAINRGNSGGPMFNQRGEVIGVNTAIFSPSGGNVGIGFAIPSAMAKPILDQLREYGRPYRGWLGVKIQHVTDEIADSLGLSDAYGALVLELTPGSPAASAGVKPGDVILKFDGKKVKEMRLLPRMVAETPVGKEVDLGIWRAGKRISLDMKLGEFPEDVKTGRAAKALPSDSNADASGETVLGMTLREVSDADKAKYALDPSLDGLLVTAVEPKSEAAKRMIRTGDVIVGVNQNMIDSIDAFNAAIASSRSDGREFALIRIVRRGNSSYVTLPISE